LASAARAHDIRFSVTLALQRNRPICCSVVRLGDRTGHGSEAFAEVRHVDPRVTEGVTSLGLVRQRRDCTQRSTGLVALGLSRRLDLLFNEGPQPQNLSLKVSAFCDACRKRRVVPVP